MQNLKPLRVVELLDRADEADVAFLDQVQQGHAAADILLGDADDEPEVGFGQLTLRFFGIEHDAQVLCGEWLRALPLATLHTLGQRDLLKGGKQRHTADLPQVHAHRVVQIAF